jgi:hypothetical protein
MEAIGEEIVILPLFAIRDYRRTCGFELFDGVANRGIVKIIELRVGGVTRGRNRLNQGKRPWDASD